MGFAGALKSKVIYPKRPSVEALDILLERGKFGPSILTGINPLHWQDVNLQEDVFCFGGTATSGQISTPQKFLTTHRVRCEDTEWLNTIEMGFTNLNIPDAFHGASRLVTRKSDGAILGIVFSRDLKKASFNIVPVAFSGSSERSYLELNAEYERDPRRPRFCYGKAAEQQVMEAMPLQEGLSLAAS